MRALRLEDAEPLFATYTSDADVARYLPWRRHHTLAETEAMIRYGEDLAASGSAYLLAIVLRAHDNPIGLLNLSDGDHGVSLGFGLARRHWGNGYSSEIITSVTGWLLDQTAIWRVWGYCDEANEASALVMTQAGMQFEGAVRRFATHPNISSEPRACKLFAAVRS
ncbi:hypothetical protein Y590_17980 [Methylobacterium sp. AMS5]|nr:hypothetical protein Y590_17980 [Methylobacterium sp. AMS5]